MKKIIYNDLEFTMKASGKAWEILRGDALVATGVFLGMSEKDAVIRCETLIRTIYPVGVKTVGPDVTHPLTIGDLKIVPPDVGHPNFIYWTKDSVSFAK